MQLRYYDGSADDNPKDVIELKDVLAVTPMKYVPGALKKADENAFFEVSRFDVLLCLLAYSLAFASVAIILAFLDKGYCRS